MCMCVCEFVFVWAELTFNNSSSPVVGVGGQQTPLMTYFTQAGTATNVGSIGLGLYPLLMQF